MCQRNVKFRNLTAYLSSSVTETIKKDLKKKFNKFRIHDKDWDEVRDSSGRIVALTVFVKLPDIAEALIILNNTYGVINVIVGDVYEPICIISVPLELSTASGAVTLESVVPEKKNQVKRIEYFIGDMSLGSSMVSPYVVIFDSLLFPNGVTDIAAVAYDKKGKCIGKSVELTITINNVASLTEWDGTEVSYNALKANPNVQIQPLGEEPTITYLDGVATMSWNDSMQSGYWEIDSFMRCPILPAPTLMEVKLSAVAAAGPDLFNFQIANGSVYANVGISNTGDVILNVFGAYVDPDGNLTGDYTIAGNLGVDLTQMHVYRLELTETHVVFSLDGVPFRSGLFTAQDIVDYNWTVFQITSPGFNDIPAFSIDYLKWSSI